MLENDESECAGEEVDLGVAIVQFLPERDQTCRVALHED